MLLGKLAVLFKMVEQNNLIFCLLLGDFGAISSFTEECINRAETLLCGKFIYGGFMGETNVVTDLYHAGRCWVALFQRDALLRFSSS